LWKRKDGNHYPLDTIYQICCGLGRALYVAGHTDADIFNAPEFTTFKDTLDVCMKQHRATGAFIKMKTK